VKKVTASLKGAEKAKSKAFKALCEKTNRSFAFPTAEDEGFFEKKVGRKPSSLIAVLKRCHAGYPIAFASLPEVRGEPFPTIFWLTCPYLLKLCGKLETALFHKNLEAEISSSEKLKEEFLKAQQKMVAIRKALAEAAEIELDESVLETGIGGVKNLLAVKCLHAHLAAGFAGIESPVTRSLYEAITVLECNEDCMREQ
jgi:hypothetical protein